MLVFGGNRDDSRHILHFITRPRHTRLIVGASVDDRQAYCWVALAPRPSCRRRALSSGRLEAGASDDEGAVRFCAPLAALFCLAPSPPATPYACPARNAIECVYMHTVRCLVNRSSSSSIRAGSRPRVDRVATVVTTTRHFVDRCARLVAMASPATVLAVVRAAKPSFRCAKAGREGPMEVIAG